MWRPSSLAIKIAVALGLPRTPDPRAADPAKARDQLAALLPDRERKLGPDMLATSRDLDYWTQQPKS